MTSAFRRTPIVVAFVLAFLATGCSGSGGGAGAVGTSGQSGPAAINVEFSSFFLVIENRAGVPLVDVDVVIKAVGGLSSFTKSISRLESGEKRKVSLGDFRGRDGTTTFSLDLVRPKEVVVTAADVNGQKRQVTVPWSR